ncbi:MAG: hypothetical protein FWE12_02615 [Oscillospiraceae bacterium]|nr:hypothetical protein [Oscillospiraceae bacterium]
MKRLKWWGIRLVWRVFWRRVRQHVAVGALVVLVLTSLYFGRWHRMD